MWIGPLCTIIGLVILLLGLIVIILSKTSKRFKKIGLILGVIILSTGIVLSTIAGYAWLTTEISQLEGYGIHQENRGLAAIDEIGAEGFYNITISGLNYTQNNESVIVTVYGMDNHLNLIGISPEPPAWEFNEYEYHKFYSYQLLFHFDNETITIEFAPLISVI